MLSKLKSLLPRQVINLYHFAKAVTAVAANGYPARDLTVIGITGTDGKTTTSHLLYSIMKQAGLPVSVITTTGAIVHGRENEPLGLHVTTPNPFDLQRFLKNARATGSKYVILEATSHGLAQYRVWGSNFQIGVVTNITHEHLDYHGTWERYFLDKARLFKNVKHSILNMDDPPYERLKKLASGKISAYSISKPADITASDIQQTPSGTQFAIPAIGISVSTHFFGDFNVQNMLAATGAAVALGVSPEDIAAGLENARPPQGRLEPVDEGQDFTVFVDFAHTSNSLDTMLKMLRGMAKKRLIVVFGCAGLRDLEKRFPMGASAGRYADFTVITAEDPRTENLENIIDEVARGCETEGGVLNENYFRIHDRQEAINFAIRNLAQTGDIVVATGKAHEQSMCFGEIEYDWDEFRAVRFALGAKGADPVRLPTSTVLRDSEGTKEPA